MITIRIHKSVGIALLVVAIMALGAGWAAAGGYDVVYYACANNSSGEMVLVAADEPCAQNETRISWNQQGPQGPAGKAGLHCWDLNGNGTGDLRSEDRNKDLNVDVLDCRVDDSVWTAALAAESQLRTASDIALEARVAELESLLAHFSRQGDDIFITGANLHVTNGLGNTETTNSLGNIIIGYNELRGLDYSFNDRSGSHMLVVGTKQNYSSFGGIVVGRHNTTSAPFASVSGGDVNTASGTGASVSGGSQNTASGLGAVISGGLNNRASGGYAAVSGGSWNEARGWTSAIGGGRDGSLDSDYAWLAGDLYESE